MPNQYFTISPTGGTDQQGGFIASATSVNSSTSGRDGRIYVTTSWGRTAEIPIYQKFRPYFNMGPSTIPASGGSITFTAYTEYDIAFRSVPEWVTITSDGVTYAEGQVISASTANRRQFTITATANTGQTRTVANTMNMGHYAQGQLQRYVSYFSFQQEGVAPTRNISLSPIFFSVGSGDTTVTVNIVETNTTLDHYTTSSAGTFNITASKVGSTFVLTFPANDSESVNRGYLSFYLYDNQGGAWTSTITVERAAAPAPPPPPTPVLSVSPTALTFDYPSYNTRTFTINTNVNVNVTSDYPAKFDFSKNGDIVTVTATTANFGTSSYTGNIIVSDVGGELPNAVVACRQLFRPRLVYNPVGTIPASGATITFTILSEYTTKFANISNLTITDTQGNTYNSSQELTPAWTSGRTFIATISQNTGAARTCDFELTALVDSAWNSCDAFGATQAAGSSSKFIYIDPSTAMLDYPATRTAYFTVTTSPGVNSMSSSIDDTTNFSVDPATVYNTVGVRSETVNQSNAYRTVTLTLTDDDDPTNVGTATIGQKYRPYFNNQSTSIVPASGGTITFVVHTDYNIDFYNIPPYVTVKDYQNNTITNGQVVTQAQANNKTFTLEFAPNNLSSSRSVYNTFCMRNYMAGTVLDYKQFFSFTQQGAQVGELVDFGISFENILTDNFVQVTIALGSGTYSYDTMTYRQDGTEDEMTTGEFDVVAAEGEDITFTLTIDSATFEPFVVHIDYNDGAEGNVDTIYAGDTISLVTQYVPGASVTFRVEN